MPKEEEMNKVKEECFNFCYNYYLYEKGTNPVFGEGSLDANLLFIGEAPGYNESIKGRPFCGAAGNVLNELLNSINLQREEVYITNVVKLRPPENREPTPEEIKEFSPFLDRQISIIKPEVICTLGNCATQYIFKKYGLEDRIQGISKIHGEVFEKRDLFNSTRIVPLYHPAIATYNPNMKQVLENDFQELKKFISK